MPISLIHPWLNFKPLLSYFVLWLSPVSHLLFISFFGFASVLGRCCAFSLGYPFIQFPGFCLFQPIFVIACHSSLLFCQVLALFLSSGHFLSFFLTPGLLLQAWQKYCGQKPTFQGVFWNVSFSPLSPTINVFVQMMSDIYANFLWDTTLIQGEGGAS